MSLADDDTRILTVAALVDDARCLTADLCDDVETTSHERILLTALRRYLNDAIKVTNQLGSKR